MKRKPRGSPLEEEVATGRQLLLRHAEVRGFWNELDKDLGLATDHARTTLTKAGGHFSRANTLKLCLVTGLPYIVCAQLDTPIRDLMQVERMARGVWEKDPLN